MLLSPSLSLDLGFPQAHHISGSLRFQHTANSQIVLRQLAVLLALDMWTHQSDSETTQNGGAPKLKLSSWRWMNCYFSSLDQKEASGGIAYV